VCATLLKSQGLYENTIELKLRKIKAQIKIE
jgi:hypothetical protein